MKQQKHQQIKILNTVLLTTALIIQGCGFSTSKVEMLRAKKAEKEQDYDKAIEHYYKFLKRFPKHENSFLAAKKLYQISKIQKKDYVFAEKVLQRLILNSENSDERMWAQYELGSLYFTKLNNYSKAIEAFSKFNLINKDKNKKMRSKINIAKSYFYLNNMFQAETEIDEILDEKDIDKDNKFEAKLLKANILASSKKDEKAIEIYKLLLKEFPKKSEKEQIAFSLSLSLEEMKKFKEAIALLKQLLNTHPNPNFIQSKIVRLEYLMKQQPGARGRVK